MIGLKVSIADQCGIQDNDILHFFGVVHTEAFTLIEVKESDTGIVEKACHNLKSSLISVGLVLVVKKLNTLINIYLIPICEHTKDPL